MAYPTIWTPEREQAARLLFNCGASASEMAADLSKKFGFTVTRSAIVGMWHRRKWTGGERKLPTKRRTPEPRNATQLAKRERVTIIVPPTHTTEKVRVQRLVSAPRGAVRVIEMTDQTVAPLREVAVTPLHLNLIDLQPEQCRYPFGDSPFTFCGCEAEPGRPYCAPHQFLCKTIYARATPDEMRSAAMKRRWDHKKATEPA